MILGAPKNKAEENEFRLALYSATKDEIKEDYDYLKSIFGDKTVDYRTFFVEELFKRGFAPEMLEEGLATNDELSSLSLKLSSEEID